MTPNIQEWIKLRAPNNPGRVLEIGSLNINGGVRQYFQNASEYIGIDIQSGPGVDRIINAHDICKIWEPNSFDTIVCLETMEHDDAFWHTASNINLLLKPKGNLFLSMPTIDFPFHYPPDYWRFTEMGLRRVFEIAGCNVIITDTLQDTIGNHGVIGYGVKYGA